MQDNITQKNQITLTKLPLNLYTLSPFGIKDQKLRIRGRRSRRASHRSAASNDKLIWASSGLLSGDGCGCTGEPIGPSNTRNACETVRVCSAVSVADCGGGRESVCRPCDSEAITVWVVVTRDAVCVTGTKGGSVKATDDEIDSVVSIPVMPSRAGARSGYGCAADTSETEVATVV
jgi:hypothetical protein